MLEKPLYSRAPLRNPLSCLLGLLPQSQYSGTDIHLTEGGGRLVTFEVGVTLTEFDETDVSVNEVPLLCLRHIKLLGVKLVLRYHLGKYRAM